LFRALVERSPDMKTMISPDGTILYGTPAITSILGYSEMEFIGYNEFQFIHPADATSLSEAINLTLSTPGHIGKLQIRVLHKNGHYLWCDKTITNLIHDPYVNAIVCNIWDISREKAAEERIRMATFKGQEKERSNVSRELHDNVNQVLTTIKLYIELCISNSIDSKEILPKCANLLNETINEIRDLSKRLSAPSLGDIGLNETLRELCESVEVTKKVRIKLDASTIACNHIDSDLHLAVYRIAQEQLTNILKHADSKKVLMKLEVDDVSLRLTIRDYGKGFDMNSTRVGIGLTNIRSRAEMLNGSVDISSEIGKGSTLVAEIPVLIEDGKCFPVSKVLT